MNDSIKRMWRIYEHFEFNVTEQTKQTISLYFHVLCAFFLPWLNLMHNHNSNTIMMMILLQPVVWQRALQAQAHTENADWMHDCQSIGKPIHVIWKIHCSRASTSITVFVSYWFSWADLFALNVLVLWVGVFFPWFSHTLKRFGCLSIEGFVLLVCLYSLHDSGKWISTWIFAKFSN